MDHSSSFIDVVDLESVEVDDDEEVLLVFELVFLLLAFDFLEDDDLVFDFPFSGSEPGPPVAAPILV